MIGSQTLRRVRADVRGRFRCLVSPTARRGRVGRLGLIVVNLAIVVALVAIVFVDFGITGNPWYRIVGITGGSMEPTIHRGDAIVVAPAPTKVEPGMVLLMAVGNELLTHRVVAVNTDGSFVTRGDANRVDDPQPPSPSRSTGSTSRPFPGWGRSSRSRADRTRRSSTARAPR